MIKISVIVPVYNTAKYLYRCINSIINQSLKEIEIIIVNDGSTDNSLEIVENFANLDKRIKIIDKKNEGLSSARNAGIEVAKGEYIINIDSDDWIEPYYFYDMYKMAKKENLDIVVSDFYKDYDNGKMEYKVDLKIESNQVINSEEYIEKLVNDEILPAVWNKMFKSDLYKKNNILHPININLGEDLATSPKLAYYAKRIAKINKAYIHYIQNQESLTKANPTKRIYELIEAFKILDKFFNNKIDFTSKKILELGGLLYNINYDINDKFYENAIEYYIEQCKKEAKINNIKLKICIKVLKMIPSKKMFKVIFIFNKNLFVLKKALKRK